MKRMKWTALLWILSGGFFLEAAEFQPIPAEKTSGYHFNLARSFYADDTGFDGGMQDLRKLAADVATQKGKVGSSGKALLAIVQRMEQIDTLSTRLLVYRYLSYATNTELAPALNSAREALAQSEAQVAFVATELRALSPEDLERLIGEEPKLAPYRYYLESEARFRPHTLSAAEEQMMSRLNPDIFGWHGDLFQELIDRTRFSEIDTASGKLQVYKDRQVLNKDKDREIRKKAYLALYDEYSASADLFGFIVIREAGAFNRTAALRGFKNAFDASLFDAYLTTDQAEMFFAEMRKYAPLMRRLIQLRKERIRQITGYETAEPWDSEVVPENYQRPVFTIEQTAAILNETLGFHGSEYVADLKGLMDPANGRLDIVEGKNRVPGAFSWGTYGSPYLFYSYGYKGYLDDLQTMAHEAGHAVHYDLIAKNGVPAVYARGPQYFTESFAMLNEFVTGDSLYRKATSREDRIFFLEEWLDLAMRRLFDITMRSEFEYRLYEKVQSGEITTAEQVHDLWKAQGLLYVGEDYERHDFLKYNWSLTPHFFTSPRYYINYLFANLMALSYYERHLSDASFDRKYVSMMKGGFPDTPVQLLQKHLSLNPFDPATIAACMKILEARVAELETLYRVK